MATMFDDLLAVQREVPALQKTAINPHFRNRYVPLEELLQTVVPILNKHNFVLLQFPDIDDGGRPCLSYELRHASGEKVGSTMPLLCAKDDPQGQGSAITYARRYSLMALLGLTADVDDDAETATRRPASAPPARPQSQQRPSAGAPSPSCPAHGVEGMKLVPGGTSKKSGKVYGAFWSCDVRDCSAGGNGKSWTMFDDKWQMELQLARGQGGTLTQEEMDVPHDE